jgi:multidrug efflux pump subunit AcrA (membrane-fusion protein)
VPSRSGPFRARALEHGDLREALDERTTIVGPPRWAALVVGVLVLLGLVAWAASAEIETTVEARGMVVPDGGFATVAAPRPGIVLTAPPPEGTVVRSGDVVATLDDGTGATVPVRALRGGTVDTVSAARGGYVTAGAELATLAPVSVRTVVVVFVATSEVAQLAVGQPVRLAPGGNGERVTRIADRAASPERLRLLLGAAAAPYLSGPPVQEVEVGPAPAGLRPGTQVTARVVVRTTSPIREVL